MAINSAQTESNGPESDVDINNTRPWPTHCQETGLQQSTLDHFVLRNGLEFAGTHLILDFWEASQLNDLGLMEHTLTQGVEASGATLLHLHLHHFTPNYGISGVAVLAESHISVHTWPERGYAAFDIFMCGDAQPEKAIPILKQAFMPGKVIVTEHLRGLVN